MLKNKIALITGASAGIGAACAGVFAREGARLILAARRARKLEKLAADLHAAHGTDCHLLTLDVRNREAVNAAIAGLPANWESIDILVNNAGLSRGLDKVQEGDAADWEHFAADGEGAGHGDALVYADLFECAYDSDSD